MPSLSRPTTFRETKSLPLCQCTKTSLTRFWWSITMMKDMAYFKAVSSSRKVSITSTCSLAASASWRASIQSTSSAKMALTLMAI